MNNVNIYQIYYNEETQNKLIEGFIPYYNSSCTLFFESEVIRTLVENGQHKQSKYFGVVGPRFIEKVNKHNSKPFISFNDLISDIGDVNADVIRLLDYKHPLNMMDFADKNHKHFKKIMSTLLDHIGFNIDLNIKCDPIYCNFFLATENFWNHYVDELMIPIMDIIQEDKHEICELIKADCGYHKILPKSIKDKYSIDKYPYHPFIIERLPSIFLMKYKEYKVSTW